MGEEGPSLSDLHHSKGIPEKWQGMEDLGWVDQVGSSEWDIK